MAHPETDPPRTSGRRAVLVLFGFLVFVLVAGALLARRTRAAAPVPPPPSAPAPR